MATFDQDEILKNVKDAVYAAVGAGVLTAEQLEKLWAELTTRLSAQLDAGRSQAEGVVTAFESRLRGVDSHVQVVVHQIDALLDEVQERLPEQAGEVVARARKAGADARQQVRSLLRLDAA
jgi:hypothetical protein